MNQTNHSQSTRLLSHTSVLKCQLAQQMRRSPTEGERRMWAHLRANRVLNLHFRRQQPLFGFIADFYCHAERLVVEVDGPYHRDNSAYDAERDAVLKSHDIRVLRFTNDEILHHMPSVIRVIEQTVRPIRPSGTFPDR